MKSKSSSKDQQSAASGGDQSKNENHKIQLEVDEAILGTVSSAADLVGSVDQGTSSTRFLVFSKQGRIAASAQLEHMQYFPEDEDKVGWHEHDPLEIWNNSVRCIDAVAQLLEEKAGLILDAVHPLAAVGITNQRETTVAWNRQTGVPYYPAIVWDDTRTMQIASELSAVQKADGSMTKDINRLRDKTGLPLASYFAGTKCRWLLDHVEALRNDLANPTTRGQVAFGTIDSWLLFQMTGRPSTHNGAANCDGIFVTDVTNASRWLFLDLETVQWDEQLVQTVCAPHSLPLSALPKICPSSHVYGTCSTIAAIQGVPLAAVLGDQQAALFGQTAFEPGEAKNTYGTGMFMLMTTGTKAVPSRHGLLTTVAYQIGSSGKVHYALEGSVSHSGSTIQWLRDQLDMIDTAAESETLARTTRQNDGLYLVPAFSGLFAPHWRSDARGCIVGMTATHHKGHICRAALEAAAYMAREVFEAMLADSHVRLKSLNVDGGGTNNQLLMQFQADMIDVPVVKPLVMETTAIGAAFAAGLAVGVWKDTEEIQELWEVSETFEPNMDPVEREKCWIGWKKAVQRSFGWMDTEGDGVQATKEEEPLEEGWVEVDLVADNPNAGICSSVYNPVALACLTLAALTTGFLLGRQLRR